MRGRADQPLVGGDWKDVVVVFGKWERPGETAGEARYVVERLLLAPTDTLFVSKLYAARLPSMRKR